MDPDSEEITQEIKDSVESLAPLQLAKLLHDKMEAAAQAGDDKVSAVLAALKDFLGIA